MKFLSNWIRKQGALEADSTKVLPGYWVRRKLLIGGAALLVIFFLILVTL